VCLKCNELDLALDIYSQMLAEGCTPNLVTFNTLLDVYAKTGHYAEALAVLDQLDMQVGACLIGCLLGGRRAAQLLRRRSSRVPLSEALLPRIALPHPAPPLQGIAPEPRTYNTIVAACNMSGHYAEVRRRTRPCRDPGCPDSMPHARPQLTPSRHPNPAPRLPASPPRQALSVYERMLAKGIEPMPATYNAAVCALARLGRLPAALALLSAVAAKGIERGVTTYAALLAACEALGRCGAGLRRQGDWVGLERRGFHLPAATMLASSSAR
jgi:pentatricopeptide repeat domain-containing protein 1